ncbi:MAG: argininosuccinate lyase [Candidatus Dormibacteria bacterium]
MAKPGEAGGAQAHAWQGRLPGGTDARLERFSTSLPQDLDLAAADLAGSRAQARALARAGLLSSPELAAIEEGLARVGAELSREEFPFRDTDEDIHMAVERRLVELVGEPGERLHAGRSRNDQIALDLRLWCRLATCRLMLQLGLVQRVLIQRARQQRATLLPGYTHLQRAQPVHLAHQLLAYFEMLERDQQRLRDLDRRCDSSPLGSGALAGTTLDLDRRAQARELGFSRVSRNSIDAVSDRDFVIELVFACSLVALHLSRLAEDFVIWNTQEFGFISLPDRWATGSSLMPQKKNPDLLELLRGRSGRAVGALVGILTVLKGLPLSYDRDLQEDRVHLNQAVGSVLEGLEVLAPLLAEIQFNREPMRAAAQDPQILATDLAEHLVLAGVPFRRAHARVAALVAEAEHRRVGLDRLVRESWARLGLRSEEEAAQLLQPAVSLRRREQPGAPGPQATEAALREAGRLTSGHLAFARGLRRRLGPWAQP